VSSIRLAALKFDVSESVVQRAKQDLDKLKAQPKADKKIVR
jgi:hypothetical protein